VLQAGAQRVQHRTFAAHMLSGNTKLSCLSSPLSRPSQTWQWPPDLCRTCSRPQRVSVQVGKGVKLPALRFDMPRAPSPDQLNVWTDFAEINTRPVVDVVARRVTDRVEAAINVRRKERTCDICYKSPTRSNGIDLSLRQ
jgi:hypothetical protein